MPEGEECTGSGLEYSMGKRRVRLPVQEVEVPLPCAKLDSANKAAVCVTTHLALIGLTAPIEESLVWAHRGTSLRSVWWKVERRGEQTSDADGRPKLRRARRRVLRRTAPGRGLPAVQALEEARGFGVGESISTG